MIKYGCCIWSWCCSAVKILRVLDSHWWKKLLLNELFFQKKHFPSGTYFIFKNPRSFFLSNTSYICHVIHVPVPFLVLLRFKQDFMLLRVSSKIFQNLATLLSTFLLRENYNTYLFSCFFYLLVCCSFLRTLHKNEVFHLGFLQ